MMSKQLMFLMTLCFAALAYAIPPDQTYVACDAETPCPDQMQCVKFEDMETPVCWPADSDPCEYCGTADCAVMESYPPQVVCGDETPDVDPVTCNVDGDCPEGYACFDGFCEPTTEPVEEMVKCENAAGYCEMGDTSGYCQCVTGEGMGWGTAEPGDPTDPGSTDGGGSDGTTTPPQPLFVPTQDECMAKLVEICGETAPDLKDSCGDKFDVCYDGVTMVTDTCMTPLTTEEKEALLNGAWIGDASQMLYQCCQSGTAEELTTEMATMKECLDTKTCDECLGEDDPQPLLPCTQDADCPDGGHCTDGTCYWTTSDGDETTTNPNDPATGGDDTGTTTCAQDGDCPNDGTCVDGTCHWTTEGGEDTTTDPTAENAADTTGTKDTSTPEDGTQNGCSLVLI